MKHEVTNGRHVAHGHILAQRGRWDSAGHLPNLLARLIKNDSVRARRSADRRESNSLLRGAALKLAQNLVGAKESALLAAALA